MDDIDTFNAVAGQFDLSPSLTSDDARRRVRYVLENDEHIDVLVARSVPDVTGTAIAFDDLWLRRRAIRVADVDVAIPAIDDLIATKQFAARPKDLEDISLLRLLKDEGRT